jgi:branched-chain amino acid transport system substrate-binding protein
MTALLRSLAAGAALAAGLGIAGAAQAQDEPLCGLGTGEEATGEPILVGAVVGESGPDDFSAGADAARAYFNCVNANGGINGRPIEYLVEDDQWNPEVAAQVAASLVKDRGVVALVGNGSFVEMTVNARLYAEENVAVVASACAVRECFEASHISSTNQGPVPSNLGAVQWAVANLGSQHVVCIGLNIPSNGVWSCDVTSSWLNENGYQGSSVVFDPGAADLSSVLLEAIATGADTLLISLPANLAVGILKAAEEQDLRDSYQWISPTPLYDEDVPAALGDYWNGAVHINIELTPWDRDAPDTLRWRQVMDEYARPEDPRDTFSQAGFVSANIFVDTLLAMDPATISRESVTEALFDVKNYRSDLLCAPWYFGRADRHQPNHAGMMVVVKDGGFAVEAECYGVTGSYFDPIIQMEQEQGLVGE